MANSVYSRNRRLYVTNVSAFGTAVSPTNSDATRYIDNTAQPVQQESVRPDLNPSLDIAQGVLGRKNCPFSGSASLAAASGAGVAPDLGKIFKAAFGLETIVASTSVTYAFDDAMDYIDLWQYVTTSDGGTTGTHEAMLSAVISQLEFSFGGNYADVKWSGECKSYATSVGLSGMDTEGKCGLASWPTEPASPVVNGAAISGYKGTITLDGNAYTIGRSGKITFKCGPSLQKDGWGSDYPQAGAKDPRDVMVDISLYDDDSSNLNSLKAKADVGTRVDLSFVLGQTAGGIYTFTLKNVMLAKPQYDNSQTKRIVNFNGCTARSTSGTSKDAFKLAIT